MRGQRAARGQRFSEEPPDPRGYTDAVDRAYTRFARAYDVGVKLFPVWRSWLRSALPHIRGPRVLEVSFGTGWLLTQYADRFEAHGVELNRAMLAVAARNLERAGLHADLRQGTVEALPYADASFDTVVNTMAFSGYPDAARAMGELCRVVRPGGRVVMVDVNYPSDGNRLGVILVRAWERTGDLIRDVEQLFASRGFSTRDEEVGGRGSVHLYVATRDFAREETPAAGG